MGYLKLKKNNYIAIIQLTGESKMVEVEAKNKEVAYEIATEYAKEYCKTHGCMYMNPVVVKIPECITVIG